jgi:nucleolar protein 9
MNFLFLHDHFITDFSKYVLFLCYELQSSQALAAALSSDSESTESIVARILFLENYLHERSNWKWILGAKMSILGCLMLQSIFQYPHVC